MMINKIHEQEELQKIIYTFAELFKYPTQDFYEEVSAGHVDEGLKSLFSNLQFDIIADLKGKCLSKENLQQQYMDLFSGLKQPFAPPIESVYKVWTTDETAQVSIAKSKGYLMGDPALHMQYLYKQFQIEVPNGYENMPDHLTLQLEFLAYLLETSNQEVIYQFIDDHLDWLDDFHNELKKIEVSDFYSHATRLLQLFLQNITRSIFDTRKE
ncbi:molecular chaperone TorD family protein [Anaerobacillus sp. CMMVII]|uniref:TorD/DmsD family molecular chaperone n=1 Tax=Anaerobacillus sp. CMMVII TaxID=2755588 RepID=UPI0021B81793|nr:molecular chaperone TorD family protein [Anaerobacillus sp. CMMVII]MCT8137549.1 molecular chaperone TorD family protein [Anaerobacillus sp. CMMVII]